MTLLLGLVELCMERDETTRVSEGGVKVRYLYLREGKEWKREQLADRHE